MRVGLVSLAMMVFMACPVPAAVKNSTSFQPANKCFRLVQELQEMERAQGILLKSMVQKNESLADTLDHYADDFAVRGTKVKKGDIVSLRKSAEAFRSHKEREAALIAKFQKSSDFLIAETTHCLAQADTKPDLRRSSQ